MDEIAYSVRKTRNLVLVYLNIIEEYKDQCYISDKLADYEVKVETVIERTVRSMTY